jgi:plasmid stability protein
MVTLTLKNIPDELHQLLKQSAARNRRSLNSEILARLEKDLAVPVVDSDTLARELRAFTSKLPRVHHRAVDRYKRQGRA